MNRIHDEILTEFVDVLKKEVSQTDLQNLLARGDVELAPSVTCSPELARAIGEVMSFLVSAIPEEDLF